MDWNFQGFRKDLLCLSNLSDFVSHLIYVSALVPVQILSQDDIFVYFQRLYFSDIFCHFVELLFKKTQKLYLANGSKDM